MHIEIFKAENRKWYWRVVSSSNGKKIVVSQGYTTKWSARRTASKMAKANGYPLKVV